MSSLLYKEIFELIHKFRFYDQTTVSGLTEQLLLLINAKLDDIYLNHDKPVDMTLIKKIKEMLK
ncbi:MAG: hypothetical protein K0S93_37 [Nitrososphaeraceae archaeon]|nr:hypothetical protein [Nitrososphaeraceae archaeon]